LREFKFKAVAHFQRNRARNGECVRVNSTVDEVRGSNVDSGDFSDNAHGSGFVETLVNFRHAIRIESSDNEQVRRLERAGVSQTAHLNSDEGA
jgi:hypothetical protein